jgi:hypothetical protein
MHTAALIGELLLALACSAIIARALADELHSLRRRPRSPG